MEYVHDSMDHVGLVHCGPGAMVATDLALTEGLEAV
jgi:hypothetical protein